jgi:hypothetical protein
MVSTQGTNTTSAARPTREARGVPVLFAPLTLVGGLFAASVAVHTSVRGFSWTAAAIALFLSINVLICFWELILYFYSAEVADEYNRSVAAEATSFRLIGRIFSARERHAGLSPKYWVRVWSYYARLDRDYIDRRSFGFNVDVGNGFSTLVPSVFILIMMTWQAVPARWLGMLMLVVLYQMAYGTVVYFFSYVVNRRGKGHSFGILLALVGGANVIWIVLPVWGMVAAVQLILSGEYSPVL